jgi:hypothetical protein
MSDQNPAPINSPANIELLPEGSPVAIDPAEEDEASIDLVGKLPGNHDNFEGELDDAIHPVPGANKHHHPAHAMSKGETKHLGI